MTSPLSASRRARSPRLLPNVPVSDLLKKKSDAALNVLLTHYRPILKGIAERQLGYPLRKRVDASDVVQDACTAIAKSFPTVTAVDRFQFLAFVANVLKRKIMDLRKWHFARKRDVRIERWADPDLRATGHQRHPTANSLGLMLLNNQSCESLIQSYSKLPKEFRHLLKLHYKQGMSFKEIGEKLGRSANSVEIAVNKCVESILQDAATNDRR